MVFHKTEIKMLDLFQGYSRGGGRGCKHLKVLMGHVSLPSSFSGCWQDFVSHCLMAKTPVSYCMDLSSITYFLIKGSMQGQERTKVVTREKTWSLLTQSVK